MRPRRLSSGVLRSGRDGPGRVLVLSFALAVVAFAASTTLTSLRLSSVSARSRDISASAMPRVLELAALRQNLHRIEDDVAGEVDSNRPIDDDLEQRLDRIDAQAAAYSGRHDALRGEGIWQWASASIESTVRGSRQVHALLVAHDPAAARATLDAVVHPAAATADTDLWRLVQSSAAEGAEAARSIESIRGAANDMSIALDVSCAVFAALLAGITLRASRRHTRFMESRADELEQFAARVAHDLLGPLQPVSLVLQMVRKSLPEDDPKRRMFDRAATSVARMSALINDMLAFAKAGGEPEPGGHASVRACVDSVLDEAGVAAADARIELGAEVPPDLWVACSGGVLTSLVSNLVRNAVKYMGDSPVRRVVVRAHQASGRVRIEVRDSGPGLPAGADARVFEPYVRADRTGQPGLGLGLATVKRLASAHADRHAKHPVVGVDSTATGCVFWFELPASEGVSEGPQATPGLPDSPSANRLHREEAALI